VNGFPLYSTVCREDISRRVGRQGVSSGVGREGLSSTVGREGRCPSQGIRKCWFGSNCRYQFCPFWHPRSRRIAARLVGLQKYVGHSKGIWRNYENQCNFFQSQEADGSWRALRSGKRLAIPKKVLARF